MTLSPSSRAERAARSRGICTRRHPERSRGICTPPVGGQCWSTHSTPRAAPARFAIKADGRIRCVDVDEIDYVTADGNYARLRGRAMNVMVRETITTMEQRLAPHGFLRVRRGTLVRMERVVDLEPLFHGEYVVLKDGTRLTSGRTYRTEIRDAFALRE